MAGTGPALRVDHEAILQIRDPGSKPERDLTMAFTWLRDFDEAVAVARKQRKPIMIDVYQDN